MSKLSRKQLVIDMAALYERRLSNAPGAVLSYDPPKVPDCTYCGRHGKPDEAGRCRGCGGCQKETGPRDPEPARGDR
jgi:hypothetical protein